MAVAKMMFNEIDNAILTIRRENMFLLPRKNIQRKKFYTPLMPRKDL